MRRFTGSVLAAALLVALVPQGVDHKHGGVRNLHGERLLVAGNRLPLALSGLAAGLGPSPSS